MMTYGISWHLLEEEWQCRRLIRFLYALNDNKDSLFLTMQAMGEVRRRWQLAAKAGGLRRWLEVMYSSENKSMVVYHSKQGGHCIAFIVSLQHLVMVWSRLSLKLWFQYWAGRSAIAAAEEKMVATERSMIMAKQRLKATFDAAIEEGSQLFSLSPDR